MPLLLVVSVAWVEIVDATRNVGDVKNETALATTTVGPGGLILALQNERDDATTELLGQREVLDLSVQDTDEARKQTDAALTQFRQVLEGRDEKAVAAYTDAFRDLGRLTDVRRAVDEVGGPQNFDNINVALTVFTQYTAVINPLLDANANVRLSINDAELRNGAELLDQVTRLTEAVARLNREITFQNLTGGLTTNARAILVSDLVADYDAFMEGIRVQGQGPYRKVAQAVVQGREYRAYRGLLGDYLQGKDVQSADLFSVPAATPSDRSYDALRDATANTVIDRANALRSQASDRQRTFVGVAALGLLLALAVTALAARSITRPLDELTAQTDEMARHRLPAAVQEILDTPLGEDVRMPEVPPVKVRTRDEVAEVAKALNTVQDRTLDLAVEQAVLRRNIADSFVNLGRRTQNLIGRQLDFITKLEHEESDPDVLENLFKLDHLATRVRRNAESLVVLAGFDTTRQWSAPVAMEAVIRSTIGEVEEYQRVAVKRVDPAKMPGAAARDLVHLMAELVENGLSFSPPHRDVEVAGHMSATGYVISVVDHGLGMSEDDLARSNQRLAGEESFTIAPSRYLGHYVAGHLAARLDVAVSLSPTPTGGVTATVTIPVEALATEELAEAAPAVPATDPAPVAGATRAEAIPAAVDVRAADEPPTAAGARSDGAPPAAPIRRQAPRPVEQALGHFAAAPVADPVAPAPPVPVRSRTPLPVRPRTRQHVAPPPAGAPTTPTAPAPAPAPAPGGPTRATPATPAPPAPTAPPPMGRPPADPALGRPGAPIGPDWTPSAPTPPAPTSPAFPPADPAGPPRPPIRFAPFPDAPVRDQPAPASARSNGNGTRPPLVHRKREAAPEGGTTQNGLRKRVRGGQMPNQSGLLVNRRADAAAPAPAPAPVTARPAGPAAEGSSTAEHVFDFLSSFEAGIQRGREEANQDEPTAPFNPLPTDGNRE